MVAFPQSIHDLGAIKDVFGILSADKRRIVPERFKDFMGPSTSVSDLAKTLSVPRTALYQEELKVPEEFIKNKLVFIAASADLASEILKSLEKAREWMVTPNTFFFGRSPFDVCLEGSGREVLQFLFERAGKPKRGKKA